MVMILPNRLLLLLLLLLLAFGTLQLNRESAGGAIGGAASYMPW
jgi:hypothetical protein